MQEANTTRQSWHQESQKPLRDQKNIAATTYIIPCLIQRTYGRGKKKTEEGTQHLSKGPQHNMPKCRPSPTPLRRSSSCQERTHLCKMQSLTQASVRKQHTLTATTKDSHTRSLNSPLIPIPCPASHPSLERPERLLFDDEKKVPHTHARGRAGGR